jgi:MOSC domain-containing protein YiiM
VREVQATAPSQGATFAACLATILELPLDAVPAEATDAEGARRWLAGLGLGLVPIADAPSFSWPGPWLAVGEAAGGRRAVVMYGVPAGVVWDPSGRDDELRIDGGYMLAALDIALARPQPEAAPVTIGRVEAICIAPSAGLPARRLDAARALPGRGLEGDRHVTGDGTFPSGLPGSALTLIEHEVCSSFSPPLAPDEHRRNIVTAGIDLNGLVGHEFAVGDVRCRGMRLCEPCTVIERYASRPVLRPLVHRGGLRADILDDGVIRVGDPVRVG